jgi:hypothetical protein
MRHDAARALRVDDEPMRESAELHAVPSVLTDAEDDSTGRRFGRPSPEATMALRHFERLVEGSSAVDLDRDEPASRRFASERTPAAPSRRRPAGEPAGDLDFDAIAAALVVDEPAAPAPEAKPAPAPINAPGRSYGSHRRADSPLGSRVAGYQPGRRTVEITGHVQAPRRRAQTSTALMARPDRVALWAFMLAMFLVLMAVATAHAAV